MTLAAGALAAPQGLARALPLAGLALMPAAGGVVPPAPLRVVGNLPRANYSADMTTAGNEAREQRAPAYIGRQACSELWLLFCNWWLDIGAGGNETPTGNSVKLAMGLEYNGVTVLAPNASLASPAVVASGGTFEAGPFYPADFGVAAFPAQAQLLTRTRCEVAVGERIPRAGQVTSAAPASRKHRAAGDASQLGGVGMFTDHNNAQVGPTAAAILGRTPVNDVAVMELGDSIGEGNSDAQQILVGQGYFDRAFASVGGQRVAKLQMGRHGGTLARLTIGGQTRRTALAKYATHVFLEFGANDLFTGTNHIVNFQNNMRTVVAALKAVNPAVKVHAVTVAPRVQSADKFRTAAGQIAQAGWDAPLIKTGANDFMAGLVAEGVLAGVFDVNAAWAHAGGNAAWLANDTDYYMIPFGEGAGAVNQPGTGTITTATTSATVTGAGTAFLTQAAVGRFIYRGSAYVGRVLSVQSDTSLTLERVAEGAHAGQTFSIAERQIGTHPGPAANILAGAALASYVAGLTP